MRKSVETRDWLNSIEPRNVRAVMKRVVEDITAIDSQVTCMDISALSRKPARRIVTTAVSFSEDRRFFFNYPYIRLVSYSKKARFRNEASAAILVAALTPSAVVLVSIDPDGPLGQPRPLLTTRLPSATRSFPTFKNSFPKRSKFSAASSFPKSLS